MPEAIDIAYAELGKHTNGYFLRICKHCRAELLGALQAWRKSMLARRFVEKDADGDDAEQDEDHIYPARMNGTTVYMTLEQLVAYQLHLSQESDDGD